MNLLEYDLAAMGSGGILGLDEVGRGCLAGPIVVGACYLDAGLISRYRSLLLEVNDSKKLTDKKRRRLSQELLETDIPFLLIYVPAAKVDQFARRWKPCGSSPLHSHTQNLRAITTGK
jgi:ribonuclease HII